MTVHVEKGIIPLGYELVRITKTIKRGETYITGNDTFVTWNQSDEFHLDYPVLVVQKKQLDPVKMQILLNSFENLVDGRYNRSPADFEGFQELLEWVKAHEKTKS